MVYPSRSGSRQKFEDTHIILKTNKRPCELRKPQNATQAKTPLQKQLQKG
jgi:hypothetical protein